MKKALSLILAACLVLGLAACGSAPATTAEPSGEPSSESASSPETAEPTGPEETYALLFEQTDTDDIAAFTDHFSFTKGELVYYFAITFKNYYSYFSYFGVDPSASLKNQNYDETKTWFELFVYEALNYVRNYLVFSEAALERGITLTDEDRAYIDEERESLIEQAALHGWEPDTYLEQMFGTNITWDILSSALEKMLLADRGYSAFLDELEAGISEEDIAKEYEENRLKYDVIDYADINFLDGEAISDEVKAELVKAFSEAKDEASYAAAVKLFVEKTVEEDKIKEAGSAQAYAEKLIAANTHEMESYSQSAMMDWAFGEDRDGDVYVQPEAENGAQHAYLLKAAPRKDEETYVDVRHILFMTETLGSAEAARAKAEEVHAEWQAGERTEESFANLAIAMSEDGGSASNGGLYEGVYRGQMVPQFEDWCFDPQRQPGDSGIVDTRYGSHVMYFIGSDLGWRLSVMNALMEKAYGEAYAKLSAAYPMDIDEAVVNAINW